MLCITRPNKNNLIPIFLFLIHTQEACSENPIEAHQGTQKDINLSI